MARLRVFVLHGPNLNLLGTREPGMYGNVPYEQMMEQISAWAESLDIELGYAQTNSEGGLIDYVHASLGQFDLIIINPGALTHTSYALRDAISGVGLPTIEVHLTNIYAREEWRAKSLLNPVCVGTICGLGIIGYRLALEAAKQFFSGSSSGAGASGSGLSFSDPNSISLNSIAAVKLQGPPSGRAEAPVSAGVAAAASAGASAPRISLSSASANAPTARRPATVGGPSNLVSISLDEVDQTDLGSLFMPTQKYEVNRATGPVNLGDNVGINEIMGFADESSPSVFVGNPPDEETENLSPEEKERLKAWMGDGYQEQDEGKSAASAPAASSTGRSTTATNLTEGGRRPYSSSESYRAVSSSGLFSGIGSSSTVQPLQTATGSQKRLTIPIRTKK